MKKKVIKRTRKHSRVRNLLAVAAHFRKAGVMKHKNEPKGGAHRHDWQRDENA